jgi:hypothetical protein
MTWKHEAKAAELRTPPCLRNRGNLKTLHWHTDPPRLNRLVLLIGFYIRRFRTGISTDDAAGESEISVRWIAATDAKDIFPGFPRLKASRGLAISCWPTL